jgi:hypothetical protein
VPAAAAGQDAAIAGLHAHTVRQSAAAPWLARVPRLLGLGVERVQLILGPQIREARAKIDHGWNNSELLQACELPMSPACPLPVDEARLRGWEQAITATLADVSARNLTDRVIFDIWNGALASAIPTVCASVPTALTIGGSQSPTL